MGEQVTKGERNQGSDPTSGLDLGRNVQQGFDLSQHNGQAARIVLRSNRDMAV